MHTFWLDLWLDGVDFYERCISLFGLALEQLL